MAVSDNTRQTFSVVLTDRIVADKAAHTKTKMQVDWLLTDQLYAIHRPIGYRGIVRPIYVVVNKLEHMWAVESTAIALATIANVDPDDIEGTSGVHREYQAFEAGLCMDEAKRVVASAYKQNQIDAPLFQKLKNLLMKAGGATEPFSKRWEVAVVLYSSIAAQEVPNCYEGVFGADTRSPNTLRQDKARGRTFVKSMLAKMDLDCADAPAPSVCIEITEKYLNAICPLMAPHIYTPKKIELKEVCSVTRRGGAVTKKREKFAHGTTKRPFDSTPLAQVFTRFPDGPRP